MYDCSNWPPPLPSLPLYPPCPAKPRRRKEAGLIEPKTSSFQEWWDDYLGQKLKRIGGVAVKRRSSLFELTHNQRRGLLPVRIPTKQDKLIWSIPLPEGSYPPNGLPIWERLYLDHPLPMLKAPQNAAMVFARQQIGKKLWKNTKGQEFILYDPQGYEVKFSYENVHDPHLTNYYQGKEIRGFLLNLGDANADGWGICTLKRFNEYRKYLRRVHISLVHKEMEHQDILQDELHRIKMYRQITKDAMEEYERQAIMEEVGAANREALRQERMNRVNRILKNIRDKERRVRRLYKRRAKEQEMRIKKGQKLHNEQELKKKISDEINRRKKIQTLRRWHESEEKRIKLLRKIADEKARQKAEKVRLKWQNKIDTQKKMFAQDDELLDLQTEVRRRNIELRMLHSEKLKNKQMEHFQELRKRGLMKKANEKRKKEDKKMADAIMTTWLDSQQGEYDLETEKYRVKKSMNSTMAELLSQDTSGPDRFSIIAMARNRIQREQTIPLQVSVAIDRILETTIEMWATKRLSFLIETVVKELRQHGYRCLDDLKIKYKYIPLEPGMNYIAPDPRGTIFKLDDDRRRVRSMDSSRTTLAEKEITGETPSVSSKKDSQPKALTASSEAQEPPSNITKAVIVNYVHFGPSDTYEYEAEENLPVLKQVHDRPKTPMPTHEVLCQAGFAEERLKDILPTLSDSGELKEKGKFRKSFKNAALQLFKKALDITENVYEPKLRTRAINKLIFLGDIERANLVRILCNLLMNKTEKLVIESEEFDWMAKVLSREVINDLLRPPEFFKVQNDVVARTKIMFYKPKPKPIKTQNK